MLRVATLDKEHCKPDECGIPCYRFCPEVLNRRYAIKFVEGQKKPAEDGHGESPSPLVTFGTSKDFDPEKNESCTNTGEKQQGDDPE